MDAFHIVCIAFPEIFPLMMLETVTASEFQYRLTTRKIPNNQIHLLYQADVSMEYVNDKINLHTNEKNAIKIPSTYNRATRCNRTNYNANGNHQHRQILC